MLRGGTVSYSRPWPARSNEDHGLEYKTESPEPPTESRRTMGGVDRDRVPELLQPAPVDRPVLLALWGDGHRLIAAGVRPAAPTVGQRPLCRRRAVDHGDRHHAPARRDGRDAGG